jgi:uncharacterized protein (DUF983 family)
MNAKAVWQGKCPRCGEGDIFVYPVTSISKFSEMNSHCSRCGAPFEPEPGFYYGSLFVSYAFNIVIMVIVWVVLYFTIKPPDWVYGAFLVGFSILSIPFSFRYSRILFLYWFGGLGSK